MAYFGSYLPPQEEDPEVKRRRLLAETISMDSPNSSMTPEGRQVGPDFPTNYDEPVEPVSSADSVRAKSDAPVEPVSSSLDRYADWAKRMPKQDDPKFKASVGRKILGGVFGVLAGMSGRPGAGIAAYEQVAKGKYRKARQEWEEEGSALGKVAPLEVASRRIDVAGQREQGIGSRFEQKEERLGTEFEDKQQFAREKLEQERDNLELKEGGLNSRENRRLTFLREALKVKQSEGQKNRALTASEGAANRAARAENVDKYIGARRAPVPPNAKEVLNNMLLADPTYRKFVDEEGIVDTSEIDEEDMQDYNRFILDFERQRSPVNPVSRY